MFKGTELPQNSSKVQIRALFLYCLIKMGVRKIRYSLFPGRFIETFNGRNLRPYIS